MTSQVWYANKVDGEQAIRLVTTIARRRPGRPRKGEALMAPIQAEKKAQKQVFDLDSFDDLTLYKMYPAPAPVTSVQEALAAVGNDAAKLVEVINDGLAALAAENARASADGWMVEDEDGNLTAYSGNSANESLGKKIGAAVLAFAKLQGYSKELPREKKAELKANAQEFIRSNPKMIESIKAQQ